AALPRAAPATAPARSPGSPAPAGPSALPPARQADGIAVLRAVPILRLALGEGEDLPVGLGHRVGPARGGGLLEMAQRCVQQLVHKTARQLLRRALGVLGGAG